jgi:protein phosphatase 1 regulatory subunit 7
LADEKASGNQIKTLRALDSQLAPLKKLETVYLEGNPCQKNDMTGYRRKIILALPQVKQIDATYVCSPYTTSRMARLTARFVKLS